MTVWTYCKSLYRRHSWQLASAWHSTVNDHKDVRKAKRIGGSCATFSTFLSLELEIAFVNRTDIYRRAIKRTFADLYGVSLTRGVLGGPTGKTTVGTARANP